MTKEISSMRIAITAAASGIGSYIATELSALGAQIAICDHDEERLEAFKENHNNISVTKADVAIESEVVDFFRDINSNLGGLDALINNAGISGPTANLEDVEFSDWENTLSVNLNSAFLCSKEAIPMIRNSGGGSIINIGSSSSFFGTPLRSAY